MNMGPAGMLDLVYAVAALFLVIGLGHVETLCSQRQQSDSNEQRLRAKWDSETKERSAELIATNERLVLEIARREQCENALRESEVQYRNLFSKNPQPMWIFDLRSLRILAVNDSALRQYGYEEREFMALTARELASPASANGFLQDVAKPCSNAEFRGVWEQLRHDGTSIVVEITAVDLRYVGFPARLIVANDISTRRLREQERSDTQQREFASRLAGGVAHHFNNILSIISGHASILLETSDNSKDAEHLEQISAAITRATFLSRQLLMVSGSHSMRTEPLALNREIQNMDETLRRVVGNKAAIQYSLESVLPPVVADAHVLEHVLVNLVLNARDAISQNGTIDISTAKVHVNRIPDDVAGRAKPGNFVRLSVRDDGCGMSPEVQAHVFEPFFTTHEVRKGAGLGLASAYGAVREHSGWIEFTSGPGNGSEFRVFLPCATTWQTETFVKAAPTQKETILLIEPDDRVRSVTRFILNRQGYRVVEADSASTALALWEGQGSQIALLFTETSLPDNISARDLASHLCEQKPTLKVIFTSGADALTEGSDAIAKPYTPEKLLDVFKRALCSA